ncbi:aromatic ring-hydroxylating dioxygenase subunit alpha [Amycolatopsis alkalitolerans]|uniref:Aromatic ring-hydroxylating dioxygenase subunit alpha n=1 Tax=Amycolatopsis alkalitolerans TaxID=2547244 RepID=A0A5C4M0S7_9PSEU|nr:aromatic ring-hydroxylating dioxygenase subunit alpha [Amycolatopsis alkalitolerans]TNC25175.1 aromatic ring-hydroxylating dioxygenase subunit alpha [Amycolatopsis alkalitolerans]
MLTAEKNERLTRVGRGTPMGELLRRYWWPIATHDMVGRQPVRRRLLGEDLVLFRDASGRVGLLAEQCPHRRASLALGCTESAGLRCGYHGWLFDVDGRCVEQPGEPGDSGFADRVRTTAYPVQELGGLVFAYLGPQPAPLLPRYDLFVWDNVWRDIGHADLPCNFLQIMENSVDPYHVEWLHGRYGSFLKELAGEPPLQVLTKKHVKVAFDVFEHGILKRRVLEGQTEEDEDWKIGHPLVFPGMLRIGGGGLHFFQIRVPIDDTHTWHVWYQTYRPAEDGEIPPQQEIPVYEVPLYDEHGEFIRDYVDGQDITAWVTQGAIADRSEEHLGRSDLGVIVLRRLYQEQIDRVEAGDDPICTYRDPARNQLIELPQEKEKFGGGKEFRHEFLTGGQTRYSPIKDDVEKLFERYSDQVPS